MVSGAVFALAPKVVVQVVQVVQIFIWLQFGCLSVFETMIYCQITKLFLPSYPKSAFRVGTSC